MRVFRVGSPLEALELRQRLFLEEEAPSGRLLPGQVARANVWTAVPDIETDVLHSATHAVYDGLRSSPWTSMLRLTSALDGTVEYKDTIICFPAPTLRTDLGQLHDTERLAVEWPDGWGHAFLRGVRIPPRVWSRLTSGKMRIMEILGMRSQEVASVLMEQVGWAEALQDPGVQHEVLDHDDRWGTLRRFTWRTAVGGFSDERTQLVLEVVNRSPEPDGSFRHYWLQVADGCRPITPTGVLGEEQEETALNAVASTFGMVGPEYERVLVAES